MCWVWVEDENGNSYCLNLASFATARFTYGPSGTEVHLSRVGIGRDELSFHGATAKRLEMEISLMAKRDEPQPAPQFDVMLIGGEE